MRIAVSGAGVVSSIGIGVGENMSSFRDGRSGISMSPELLQTVHRLPVGEVRHTDSELCAMLGLPASCHMSRTALLGMLAVKEALADASVRDGLRVGLVSATSVGGMDLTEHFFEDYMRDSSSGRLRDVKMHDCAASTKAIAEYCGINGYSTTISTACSSAANAIMFAARLIRHGIVDCVVAGGTDALSAFTLNGFKSLMILDEEPCRPFDEGRKGLNLGEGAGYLVLQREDTLSKEAYCYLSGYANFNDAYHQTASSPSGEGGYLAMKGALEMAGISPEDVSYVNVHGTGTGNNDASEGAALKRLFGGSMPKFSSTKGFTGHTLAAAGGIEAVFSVMALSKGCVYPDLRFRNPVPELGLIPETSYQENCRLENVLTNSFGFGGNCTSLVFSK